MSRWRRRLDDDRGETLIELLVTVLILGTAVVAILGALATAVKVTGIHRKQANANSYVRAYAEKLQSYVAGGGYTPCAAKADYEGRYPNPDAAVYDRSIVGGVEFWTGSAWQATSAGCADTGLQRVKLQVNSKDNMAVETLTVLLRKPCKVGEALCTA